MGIALCKAFSLLFPPHKTKAKLILKLRGKG